MTVSPAEEVELVVIGAGAAGITAAITAADLGAHVMLVDEAPPGGDCLWTGCVPSKTLIAAAATAHRVRTAARDGIRVAAPAVDYAAVRARIRNVIDTVAAADSPETLAAHGIDVRRGRAVFTGPRLIEVDGQPLRFRRAVIATGTTPALPPIPGLAAVALTSDDVWDLPELPERLVVLGGGAIGCELGQAFARLGSAVTLVEAADTILPVVPPAAATAVARALTAEGVTVTTGATVTAVTGSVGDLTVHLSGPATVRGTHLLVATGRRPTTGGLGCAAAGVDLDKAGFVKVDHRLRTSNRAVYAAGDVTGSPALTPMAGLGGSIAVVNALLGTRRRLPEQAPTVIFTDPEVALIGRTRAGAGERVRRIAHSGIDRGVIDRATAGFTEIVLDRRGRIVGATIVSPRGGEMLAELAPLVARRVRLRELTGVAHPYPTFSQAIWTAAIAESRAHIARPAVTRLTTVMRRARR